jgi:hypothetical protein
MATMTIDLNKSQKKLFKEIEKATNDARGYLLVDRTPDLEVLYEAGQITVSKDFVEGTNQYGAKVKSADDAEEPSMTPTTDQPQNPTTGAAVKKTKGPKPTEIAWALGVNITAGTGVPIQHLKRGGKKEEIYPFSKMEIGDSFLIPATEDWPEPWFSFASTVSSATRRYTEKSPTETIRNRKGQTVPKPIYVRKFALRRVTKGDKYANGYVEPQTGARVQRII